MLPLPGGAQEAHRNAPAVHGTTPGEHGIPSTASPPGEHGNAPAGEHGNAPAAGHGSAGEHAEPGAGAHGGEHGGEEHEEGVSIHFPSLVYYPLKKLWHRGPATLNADGAVDANGTALTAAELKGKEVEFTYVDHHSTAKPKPKIPVRATIGQIGATKPTPSAKTEIVTIDGRQVTLVNPVVDFTWEHMLPEHLVLSLITALVIVIVAFLLTRNLQRVPTRSQAVVEMLYEYFDDFVKGLIGPTYKKYVPLIATSFIYILTMNLAGLIPAWASPTANINVTAGMAIVIVAYVQYEGLRANGIVGYLKHFAGEPWWLAPLNFPIHVVGEVARVLSLAMRLFGNIFGEDVVIVILIILAGMFTGGWFPVQAPMYLLAIFTSLVQALVFSLLTCVYIALATTHEDGHGHQEHGQHHGHDHADAPAVV